MRIQRSLRRRRIRKRGRDVVCKSTHESTNGGTLSGACGGDNGGFDRQRLLGQPSSEPALQFLKTSLQLLYWVLLLLRHQFWGRHNSLFSFFFFSSQFKIEYPFFFSFFFLIFFCKTYVGVCSVRQCQESICLCFLVCELVRITKRFFPLFLFPSKLRKWVLNLLTLKLTVVL